MHFKTILKFGGLTLCGLIANTFPLSSPAHASCSPEPYLGTVCITAAVYCPRGYIELGPSKTLPNHSSEFQDLFSLISTIYGGDFKNTFKTPETAGRILRSPGHGPDLEPATLGDLSGSASTRILYDNMPSHTHNGTYSPYKYERPHINVSTENGTKSTPEEGDYLAVSNKNGNQSKSFTQAMRMEHGTAIAGSHITSQPASSDLIVEQTGNGQSIRTVPPQLGLRFCLANMGYWPPRH